jgi:hypothetical protein
VISEATGTTPAMRSTRLLPEQVSLVELTRRFPAGEIRPIARDMDKADVEVPWQLWRHAGTVGLTSFLLPREVGGGGTLDAFTQCLAQEELCSGDLALGELVTAAGFFAGPPLQLGNPGQQYSRPEPSVWRSHRWLPSPSPSPVPTQRLSVRVQTESWEAAGYWLRKHGSRTGQWPMPRSPLQLSILPNEVKR